MNHADEKGGLSGAPIAEKNDALIKEIKSISVKGLPIIAVGGIDGVRSGQRKLDAGASLMQVYTGLIYQGPSLIKVLARLTSSSLMK